MRLVLLAATAAALTAYAAPALAQTASQAAAIEEFKRGQANADAAKEDPKMNQDTITIMSGIITTAQLPPEWAPFPYFYRGQAYRRLEKFNEAMADFDKTIAMKPDLAAAYFESGLGYAAQQKYKQAIKSYDGAVKLQPDNANFVYSRCVSKSWVNDNAGAREDCRKAVTLKPDFVEAWLTLGRAHEDLGQLDKAEECYKEVVKLEPKNKSAKEGLDFIAEKRKAIKAGGG